MPVIKVILKLLSLYSILQRISRDPDAPTSPVTSIWGFRNVFFLTSVFEKKKKEKKTLNSKKYLSDKFELIKMKGYYFYLPRHTCSIFGQTVLRSIFHPKKKQSNTIQNAYSWINSLIWVFFLTRRDRWAFKRSQMMPLTRTLAWSGDFYQSSVMVFLIALIVYIVDWLIDWLDNCLSGSSIHF